MFKVILLISFAFVCAFGTLGVDISSYQGAVAQSTFECFAQNGKEFLIIQVWQGGYEINANFAGNYDRAKAAGIQYIDAYAFICNNCAGNTACNICASIKGNLPSGFSGQVWLDIETCSGCWTGSSADRLSFIESVSSTCSGEGLKMAIYSGQGSWEGVFGSASFSAGSLKSERLWYAHYDGSASFSDYPSVAFGGFTTPNMKQYAGDATLCGTDVDLDYY